MCLSVSAKLRTEKMSGVITRYAYCRDIARISGDATKIREYDGSELTAVAAARLHMHSGQSNGDAEKPDIKSAQWEWDPIYARSVFSSAVAAQNLPGSGEQGASFANLKAVILEGDNRFGLKPQDLSHLRNQALVEMHVTSNIEAVAMPDGLEAQSQIGSAGDECIEWPLFESFLKSMVARKAEEVARQDTGRDIAIDVAVTADDFGRIFLWKVPASLDAEPLASSALCSGRIQNIDIVQLPDNIGPSSASANHTASALVVGLDAETGAILQWALKVQHSPSGPLAYSISWDCAAEALSRNRSKLERKFPKPPDFHSMTKDEPGDQMLALGLAPSGLDKQSIHNEVDNRVSSDEVTLCRVFGRSESGFLGPNVFLDAAGRVVYPAGGFVVCLDRETLQQQYGPHNAEAPAEKVSALAVSCDGLLAASGWTGKSTLEHNGMRAKSGVLIWDTRTGSILDAFKPFHGRVCLLRFSRDAQSRFILCVGGSIASQAIVVYDRTLGTEQRIWFGNCRIRDVDAAHPDRNGAHPMPLFTVVGDRFVYALRGAGPSPNGEFGKFELRDSR